MLNEIKIPFLGFNDEYVILGKWYIQDYQIIKKGDVLCSLETTKIVSDLESEFSGYVKILISEGSRIKTQATIGYIADTIEELRNIDIDKLDVTEKTKTQTEEIMATKKAIKFAQKHGIDLKKIKKSGIIKEKDVVEHYDKNVHISQEFKKEKERIIISETNAKKVDEYFIKLIEKDETFKWLSSKLKIYLYKKFGAKIGDNVKIGKGSSIIGKHILIEDNVEIKEDVIFKVDYLKIDKGVTIESNSKIETKIAIFGKSSFIGEKVLIGGGNSYNKDSGIIIGENSSIYSECIINTTKLVKLGINVGLSPRVIIYTHQYWQSPLEGYKVNIAEVVIGDNTFVTSNVTIAPGVKIGKGCVILANSLVMNEIEDNIIAGGIPAKKIYRISSDMKNDKKIDLTREIIKELVDNHKVIFMPFVKKEDINNKEKMIVISFEYPSNFKRKVKTLIDLKNYIFFGEIEDKENYSIWNFLRRKGIRLLVRDKK